MQFELHIDDPNLRLTQSTERLTRVISEIVPPVGTPIVYRNKVYYVREIEARVVPPGEYSEPSLEWRMYVGEKNPNTVVIASENVTQAILGSLNKSEGVGD